MDTEQNLKNEGLTTEIKIPPFLIDLIPQYLKNRRKEINLLNEAISSKDFLTIQNIGHKLKGNAGSYGFKGLTDVGAILEQAGKSRNLDLAQNYVRIYINYLDHIKISSI